VSRTLTARFAVTAMALFGAAGWGCSSSSSPQTARGDAGVEADAGEDCGPPHNEAGCPATYDTGSLPTVCAPVGLQCVYPGQGDGIGCMAAASLSCVAGGVDGDAGGDAGQQGRWVAAQ